MNKGTTAEVQPEGSVSSQVIEFRPELLSRRGEIFAWGSALLVWAAWIVLLATDKPVMAAVPILAILLLLTALSISLGNWMDRRTRIRIEPDSITYDNGLRHTHMVWDEIRQVEVIPSAWGKKVKIIGTKSYFAFRTLGEVKVQGEVKGRMGFSAGEQILRQILRSSHLGQARKTDSGYYYARE